MNIEEAKAVLKLKSIEFSKNIEHEAFDNIEKADFSLEKEAIETVLAELDEISKQNSTQKDTIGEMLKDLEKQEKIINAMAEDMFCYLNNTIFTYLDTSTFLLGLLVTAKKVNSVEELKQYYEKKVSGE